MIGFIARRILQAIVVIVGVVIILFLLEHLIPGGAAKAALGQRATPQQIHTFNVENGYDLPIWDQLWRYLEGLAVHLNLGYSYKYNQPVSTVIAERLPRTLVLLGVSTVVALIIAVPLGILQVVRRNKPVDYAATGVSFLLYAMPDFLFGTILILYFAIDLHWFSTEGPQGAQANSLWSMLADWRAMTLPVITLAATTIALFSRYMRSSMMDAMAEDFIRTARAKGAAPRRVLFIHALRNALIPILTLLGLSIAGIVSGAVITEDLFNFPGMGLLTVQAAENNDVPTLIGTTLVATVAVVVGSLAADLLYAVADPRIRFGRN